MEESMKALIAEIGEITGKGRGEQKVEMPLERMRREEIQLSTKPGMRYLGVDLGSPGIGGWAEYACPSCDAALRYLFVPPPWGTPLPLRCPECGADLGISGSEVVKTVQAKPPSPTYPCPHCTEVFGSWARLFEHIEDAHAEAPVTPTPTPTLITKIGGWLKSYWPHVTVGGLGVVLAGTVIVKTWKKR